MEAVCVKLDEKFLKDMDDVMETYNYMTRTEFIRDALRAKIKELKDDPVIKALRKFQGSAKVHVSDERLREIREEVGREYAKKFGIELD